MKTSKSRAYPRTVKVQKKDILHFETLIADIPYRHSAHKINTDASCSWVMYTIRLKTQELLAFELAGYDPGRPGTR